MQRFPYLPYVLAALVMVAIFFATQTRLDGDTRAYGDLDDLDALSARSDLNLLFVLVDTLRADHLGAYGYHRPTSPNLDALARSGIRFSNHLAQSSWTKTSMASLWTSLYPGRVGVLRATDVVSPEAETPAERLREAGFRTIALWRNGWVAPNFGFSQGFDAYISPRPGRAPTGFRRANPGIRVLGSDFDAVDSFAEYLRTSRDARWLVYLHLMDVHQYATDEHSALFGSSYLDAYDNAIHFTDRAVRELTDLLEKHELRDRTLIAVVSDHGEAFGEHGAEGHARDVHTEVTRTPWILSLPFRLREPVVVDAPSENVDVWPTLLELLGIESNSPSDGRTMLPAIRSAMGDGTPPPLAERRRISHIDRNWARRDPEKRHQVALTRGRYRLYAREQEEALFDLAHDPGERRDVADSHPEITASLSQAVDAYLDEDPVWRAGVPQVELDDMQLGQLRALGYVIEGGR